MSRRVGIQLNKEVHGPWGVGEAFCGCLGVNEVDEYIDKMLQKFAQPLGSLTTQPMAESLRAMANLVMPRT